MQRYKFILLLIFGYGMALSQFSDNFSDGDFYTNPVWKGDIQDFIINTKYQLQLDAPDAGSSILFSEYSSFDSIEWGLSLNLDFNPSNSNKLRVYLMINGISLDSANGYFIEIGENGDDDKLSFYKLNNGESILLGEGNPGDFSEASQAEIKVIRLSSGLWQIFKKQNEDYFIIELEVYDSDSLIKNPYFLLYSQYTKTRIDKFSFDNIYIKKFEPDTKPPQILESKLIGTNVVQLIFDEPIDGSNLSKMDYFLLEGINDMPTHVEFNPISPNKIVLNYNQDFESGKKYKLFIKGLTDVNGNRIVTEQIAFFFLVEKPKFGDLIVNEILFNPFTGGSDFVEIINISNKFIDLEGLLINNIQKENKGIIITKKIVLSKNEIICLTQDTVDILNDYFIPDSALVIQNKLPSFDDDEGNVSLYIFDSTQQLLIMIDSFEYSERMHSTFIDKDDGISLERKSLFSSTNDRFNWSSGATDIGGATPGYKNSSHLEISNNNEIGLSIINKVFSPDFDDYNDQLLIQYKFETANNLANVYILDSKGRLINQLINNETIGIQGIITWNGFVESQKAPIGIYLLLYIIIDENGNHFKGKKAFVLAEYLK